MIKLSNNYQENRWLWAVLLISLFLLVIASLFLGRYPKSGFIPFNDLRDNELARLLVFNVRLPRLLTSLILGMVLAGAGTVFQMVFANPLIEPGFLGVSQGAAFGAAMGIVFWGATGIGVQGLALVFSFAGLGLSYLLSTRIHYGGWLLRLVLAGIAVSAMFSAGLGILKYLADPLRELPEITFWLLGGLSGITWPKFLSILPSTLMGLAVMLILRWRLNLLALSETTAFSLGAAPRKERLALLTAAVLATAGVISVAGMVGWVGLIIPHITRRLFGSDARHSLPAALLLGGMFSVLCDDLARLLIVGEIPLGILTSLFGAAIFIGLLAKPNRQAVE